MIMPPPQAHDFAALSERVTSLESSICSCPDCVTHRDKARMPGFFAKLTPEQKAAALAYDGPENHGDPNFPKRSEPEAPAWQRAKVGDLVRIVDAESGNQVAREVALIEDPDSDRCRIAIWVQFSPSAHRFPRFVPNETVLSILPPEPAAPVQDDHNTASAAGAAGLADDGRSGAPAQDVKHLARGRLSYALANYDMAVIAVNTLADAGLLAGTPQPLTIDWNTALDAFHSASRPTYGTASDGVMAVLKLVPGLRVEE